MSPTCKFNYTLYDFSLPPGTAKGIVISCGDNTVMGKFIRSKVPMNNYKSEENT